jgi:regulator of sigma E protease
MIAQLMLSLTILVVLHEAGHFIPARLFGTRVNKFYLFFDFLFPFPNLLNFSLFKFKRGDTEYGIGWFPFGGYVQIDGMMDETQDGEAMSSTPQPWEFRSKRVWQRLIVMIGGVTVNFFLGILIFSGVLYTWGEQYLPTKNATYGIACDTLAEKGGFKDGDKIVSLDGVPLERLEKLRIELFLKNPKKVTVQRDSTNVDIPMTTEFCSSLGNYRGDFITYNVPFQIDSVTPLGANGKGALRKGDRLVGFVADSTTKAAPIYMEQVREKLLANKGKTTQAHFLRNGRDTILPIAVDEFGKIGVALTPPDKFLTFENQTYSLLAAVPAGFDKSIKTLGMQISAFGKIFRREVKASESFGGFGSMGQLFGGVWDWHRFWTMTGLISLMLAFFNLLPIPMLDGGYIMFLLYEMVTGREPHPKFMEIAQYVGLILILGLMLFSNGMDIYRGLAGYFH